MKTKTALVLIYVAAYAIGAIGEHYHSHGRNTVAGVVGFAFGWGVSRFARWRRARAFAAWDGKCDCSECRGGRS